MSKFTLDEIQKMRDELIGSAPNPTEGIRTFFRWIAENENNFSPEGDAFLDIVFDRLFKAAKENVEKQEDSPQKREAMRMVNKGLNEHFNSGQLLHVLESPPSFQDDFLKAWTELSLKGLQVYLDFLHDVVLNKGLGNYRVVFISMFYSCVDEFTSAIHLARHNFFSQSSSSLRSILEILDRIELFSKDTQWAELWSSGDEKKIWNELRPKAVRKKLGRDEKDEKMYSFLSEVGTHPTFKNFLNRTVKDIQVGESKSTNEQARVFVSGTPFEHIRIVHYALALQILNQGVSLLASVFGELLNKEEVEAKLKEQVKDFKYFIEKFFIPKTKELGIEADELTEQLLAAFDE